MWVAIMGIIMAVLGVVLGLLIYHLKIKPDIINKMASDFNEESEQAAPSELEYSFSWYDIIDEARAGNFQPLLIALMLIAAILVIAGIVILVKLW
ncbi:MAG: hypothetical protein GX295_05190 [Syntrophomonadaceae bacterium]|nr:hypothetical protein [Syntrophomonadaceae bacterium]